MGLALFLHWGPGSDCRIERSWFGGKLAVDWWDQPRISSDFKADAFEDLVQAAEGRLCELAGTAAVPVIAHSFGGQLALELVRRQPERVSELVLLSCSHWPPRAFLRLAKRILESGEAPPELELAYKEAIQGLTPENFWPLAQALGTVPNLFAHYWSDENSPMMARYGNLAGSTPPVDLGTFAAVMNAYLQRPHTPKREKFQKPVRYIYGNRDALIDASIEIADWKTHFPQLEAYQVQTGHFVQFEAAPEAWLPRKLLAP